MSIRLLCRSVLLLLLVMMLSTPAQARPDWSAAAGQDEETPSHEVYYERDTLNAGLPERDVANALQTPQATLEYFVKVARQEQFMAAGYALNLNLLPVSEQAERAPELARKLVYLLQQHALIDWDTLPDRPDGQIDTRSSGSGMTDTMATPLAVLAGLLWMYVSARLLLQLTEPILRWFDFLVLLLLIIAGTWLGMRRELAEARQALADLDAPDVAEISG